MYFHWSRQTLPSFMSLESNQILRLRHGRRRRNSTKSVEEKKTVQSQQILSQGTKYVIKWCLHFHVAVIYITHPFRTKQSGETPFFWMLHKLWKHNWRIIVCTFILLLLHLFLRKLSNFSYVQQCILPSYPPPAPPPSVSWFTKPCVQEPNKQSARYSHKAKIIMPYSLALCQGIIKGKLSSSMQVVDLGHLTTLFQPHATSNETDTVIMPTQYTIIRKDSVVVHLNLQFDIRLHRTRKPTRNHRKVHCPA